MYSTFPLQIISPARMVYSGDVSLAEIPGSEGYFGVLPGHAPLFALLRPGIVTLHAPADMRFLRVEGGYAEVTPGGVTLLVEQVEELSQDQLAEARAALAAAPVPEPFAA